jgi:signal transduction histidine kinase
VLKLHQIYFKKLALIFVGLFIVMGLVVAYWIKNIYISQIKNSLLNDIKLISLDLKNNPNLDNLAIKIKKNLNIRVTFIAQNGKVLAESYKDKTTMDNHKFRPEIMQARRKNFGSSIRKSATLNKDLLYVAKRYKMDNQIIYIRLAKEIKKIDKNIENLALKSAFILLVFFIVLFLIIYNIGKKVENEIDKISKFLVDLAKKKRNSYISSNFSLEFYKITKLLSKVATILTKRDKKKAKITNKLKLANAQKDTIISAISHEFKNPITVINGYSKTLLDDENINKEIERKFLQKIYSNGEKLSSLIDRLRLSVKLEGESIKLNKTEFNLYEMVLEQSESLKQIYPQRNTELKGEKDIIIKADKILLGVAVANLMENALKYSEDRVEVIISKESIIIKDFGIGIDEQELKNITKKFYRISRNSWNNSLGLGLDIVTNILKLHNFKLKIKSRKNEGSEFKIEMVTI